MSFAETIMAETSMKCSSPEMRLERNFRKVPKIEVGYYDESEKNFALIRNITINIGCSCVHK